VALISSIPLFAGAVDFNQFITIKDDGSGTIKVVYKEKESLLKGKNFLIGNLTFEKEKLAEYFNSPEAQAKDYTVGKNPKDNTSTEVSLTISFTDIKSLNNLKGLQYCQYNFAKTDSGNVFTITFSEEFFKTNTVNQVFNVLYAKGGFKSTNGVVKDNSVTWFRLSNRMDFKNPLFATLKSGAPTTTTKTTDDEKGKGCGLFGIELPFVVLLGSILMNSRRIKFLK
jgi:hypothetical protein